MVQCKITDSASVKCVILRITNPENIIPKASTPIELIKSLNIQIDNHKDTSKCHHEKIITVYPK